MSEIEIVVQINQPNQFAQMKHWCVITFEKERTIDRACRWWIGAGWGNSLSFRFSDVTDAMAFKLMWGGD